MTTQTNLKQRIIHESLRLFSLKGFLNTSIEDILVKANTSKGGFYNHFKSKDALFLAVLDEARKIWREKVLNGLDAVEKPLEKVARILKNYRDRYLKDEDNIPGGCVFVTLSVELDDQRPDFAEELNKGFRGVRSMIERLLTESQGNGELKNTADPEAVSQMLFAGMLGASVVYGMNRSDETLNRVFDPLIGYIYSLSA